MTVTNVNSPRRVDEEILDNIMVMARHGQCVVITPFTLMGAMAPVTLAGALVQQTAEALCVIALCQMLRPGTPCVMGGFTSNVDMRTGSPAFGTPEYVNAVHRQRADRPAAQASGAHERVNASPAVDAQSTYETAFSLQAAILSHSHLINHAAGWLEGGLSASLEKIVVDAEMLRSWAEILKPVNFNEDDLAVDAIKGVAAGGHFFGDGAHARALRACVLPSAAVRLVELRELDRGRRAQRDAARHRRSGRSCSPNTCRRRSIRPSKRRLTPTWRADAARAWMRDGMSVAPRSHGMQLTDRGIASSMTAGIMNARMYAVTPEVEAAWRSCSSHITAEAGCGTRLPALSGAAAARGAVVAPGSRVRVHVRLSDRAQLAPVIPIAAPIPRAALGGGRARLSFRSDREDAMRRYRTLIDTFGGRAGWTVEPLASGFNAFRHHLLAYRTAQRPKLYAEMTGNLVTARNMLDSVRRGRIDIGPLDAYWHLLIARHAPQLTAGIRVLGSTQLGADTGLRRRGCAGRSETSRRLRRILQARQHRARGSPLERYSAA